MKTLFSISLMLVLPFLVAAQSAPPSANMPEMVKKVMKDVQMGMPLADFQKAHPKATIDANAENTSRLEYLEYPPVEGIKEITYYFVKEGKNPFYEVIIEFNDNDIRQEVANKLFGAFNHPKVSDHWVIYNGDKGFLTVGWIYESKVIFSGNVPGNSYEKDEMFDVPADFKKTDKRINKNDVFKPSENNEENVKKEETPKGETGGLNTCQDYEKAISTIFEKKIALKETTAKTISSLLPNVVKQPKTFDFKEEYLLKVNENGLKEATFVFGTKGDKPLYEIIFEFANEDTTQQYALMDLGKPNHPSLDNHWVLGKSQEGIAAIAWVFNAKMVIAANLPGTEFENDETFKLPEDFDPSPKKEGDENEDKKGGKTDNNSETEESITAQINSFLAAANDDFSEMKGDAVEGKKDVFQSTTTFQDAEQTLIRKNTAGKWRLEASFAATNTDDAAGLFDKKLETIQSLEGLEYRLVKKTETSSATGKSYVWDVQTLDDVSTGTIMKLQMYKTSTGDFAVKLEIGK